VLLVVLLLFIATSLYRIANLGGGAIASGPMWSARGWFCQARESAEFVFKVTRSIPDGANNGGFFCWRPSSWTLALSAWAVISQWTRGWAIADINVVILYISLSPRSASWNSWGAVHHSNIRFFCAALARR